MSMSRAGAGDAAGIGPGLVARVETDGWSVAGGVLAPDAVAALGGLFADPADLSDSTGEAVRRSAGARNALWTDPRLANLASDRAVLDLVEPVLGPGARAVRVILFDKTPAANWGVAWHQDQNIAVAARHDVPGFGPWTVKAGVHHVVPPAAVLEAMLTIRLHLDDCGPDNGPLMVLPGTHRAGLLRESDIERLAAETAPETCHAPAGGAIVMRPLLIHASRPAATPGHRRVIHIEYAAAGAPLPPSLAWQGGYW